MFTDFTTAETLARHRAAELQRRIDLQRRRAQQTAPRHHDERAVGRVLGTLHLARQRHAGTVR